MINVLSFQEAINQKLPYKEYNYKDEEITNGSFLTVMDFKIYAKNATAITCFFYFDMTGKKIAINVFKDKKTGQYKLPNCNIDFKTCPLYELYLINIEENSKGNLKIVSAKIYSIKYNHLNG